MEIVVVRLVDLFNGTLHEIFTWEEYLKDLDAQQYQILNVERCEA
ncbi:MAG: hypothetical protein ACQEXE_10555 [Bacillota bacterium]